MSRATKSRIKGQDKKIAWKNEKFRGAYCLQSSP
jgi:hypothetical protein